MNARALIHDQTQRALNTAILHLAQHHALGHERAWTPQDFHTITVLMQRAEQLGRMLNQYQCGARVNCMLYVPTMVYFITLMQWTYFARFAIAFVCHCVCLASHAPQARKKIFYERVKVNLR